MPNLTTERTPNRLIKETSPYLLQHAHNPVDWYPWGDEALDKAEVENKPILLSIGYSACHWCHVMERECFEDESIARLMNRLFVSIKVDREERPDLDHIYQAAAQLLSNQGGWPLNVFLTPDRKPFFAGTYFPPQERYGRPGFPQVLKSVRKAFDKDRKNLETVGSKVVQALTSAEKDADEQKVQPSLTRRLVLNSVQFLAGHFDQENGGFGDFPKFPNTQILELFLRQNNTPDGDWYLNMATFTLRQMAESGICDQLGGGFHRYSTDEHWLVPHFEKMLYDNALLLPLYLSAYQVTGDRFYAQVAQQTADYVLREMTHQGGGFFSTQDADSEGEEGTFYVWSPAQLEEALGTDDAAVAAAHFGVSAKGNFERGLSVLHVSGKEKEPSEGLGEADFERKIQQIKERLFQAREGRPKPFRDEKLILSWNGLMISALARAGRVLQRREYVEAARRSADFILKNMRFSDGRLRRVWAEWAAKPSGIPAQLEDYAALTLALLDLYEATLQEGLITEAEALLGLCLEDFWDEAAGGFYLVPPSADLIHRPKDAQDQSTPSGNALATSALLRLHAYRPEAGYLDRAERVFTTFYREMEKNPWGSAALLAALDSYLRGTTEVVIVYPPGEDSNAAPVQELVQEVNETYVPTLALRVVDVEGEHTGKQTKDGKATAYVCRNFSCSPPLTSPAEMARHLSS